jgi:hypothetical protein
VLQFPEVSAGSIIMSFARHRVWIAALPILLASCYPPERTTPPPAADASAKEVALAGAEVMIGAGDIGLCGSPGAKETGAIVDSILKADSAAKVENAVFTMGDNAYPSGSRGYSDIFNRCFTPSWGKPTIMKFIHPAPGNHDFENDAGPGYYKYFGARAGPPNQGYYSYDVGEWHVISLNSEILVDPVTPGDRKAEEDWLREDLKAHQAKCTMAYFHRPLFTSGLHGPTPEVLGLWDILYEGGADLIVNGHDHHYERFLAQTPDGVPDSLRGIEEIIVGTGGGVLRGVRNPLADNSAVQIHGYFGVLKLTLGAGEYRHAFLDTYGRVWDRGGRKCH